MHAARQPVAVLGAVVVVSVLSAVSWAFAHAAWRSVPVQRFVAEAAAVVAVRQLAMGRSRAMADRRAASVQSRWVKQILASSAWSAVAP